MAHAGGNYRHKGLKKKTLGENKSFPTCTASSSGIPQGLSHLSVLSSVLHSLTHPVGGTPSVEPCLCLWDAACVALFVYSSWWPFSVSQRQS